MTFFGSPPTLCSQSTTPDTYNMSFLLSPSTFINLDDLRTGLCRGGAFRRCVALWFLVGVMVSRCICGCSAAGEYASIASSSLSPAELFSWARRVCFLCATSRRFANEWAFFLRREFVCAAASLVVTRMLFLGLHGCASFAAHVAGLSMSGHFPLP